MIARNRHGIAPELGHHPDHTRHRFEIALDAPETAARDGRAAYLPGMGAAAMGNDAEHDGKAQRGCTDLLFDANARHDEPPFSALSPHPAGGAS